MALRAGIAERPAARPDEELKATRASLQSELQRLVESVEAIALARDEEAIVDEIARLQAVKQEPTFWTDSRRVAATIADLERWQSTLDRLARLRDWLDEVQDALLVPSPTRGDLDRAAASLRRLGAAALAADRELRILDDGEGRLDAIVSVIPVAEAGGRRARDLLVETYRAWAAERSFSVAWVLEPASDEEPAVLTIRGAYAFGYLRGEVGLHRVREGDERSVARVRVFAWRDEAGPLPTVEVVEARALKSEGQFGGRLRSRLECAGGLVLQNGNKLSENRDLAVDLLQSWSAGGPDGGEIVRRYDYSPFLVRDALTGFSSGRADSLGASRFHELLSQRIDALARG